MLALCSAPPGSVKDGTLWVAESATIPCGRKECVAPAVVFHLCCRYNQNCWFVVEWLLNDM